MEGVLVEIISQFGVLGLILAGIIYLIVEGIKNKNGQSSCSKKINESINDLTGKIDGKFDDVNRRIDLVNKKVDTQYELINKRIDAGPDIIMKKINDQQKDNQKIHFDKVMQQFSQAPRLHTVLKNYRERIGCDHIFFGTFHNGGTSISGIPYCKFDITAEKFKPEYNNKDRELAIIYKNSDILAHDNLPVVLAQEDYVYYKINADGSSDLEKIDDILYRRCLGRGIKQIALNLIRDKEMNIVGFVGCISFDYDELDFKELNNCAKELEEIYK